MNIYMLTLWSDSVIHGLVVSDANIDDAWTELRLPDLKQNSCRVHTLFARHKYGFCHNDGISDDASEAI